MQDKTLNALGWIVAILDKQAIPYCIGGGFAAHMYGSTRKVNDIDISLSGKYFDMIIPEVEEFIAEGPKHYSNEKWDCDTLSLNYHEQEIDMTDIDTLRMSDLDRTQWFQTKDHFRKYSTVPMVIQGITVQLMGPRDLLAYKRHLVDRDYQAADVQALEKYIADGGLE